MPAELVEQPTPDASRCPDCGGEPLPEETTSQLSALGYCHNDKRNVCAACGHEWSNGIPIGAFDGGEDLRCPHPDCDEWGRVINVDADSVSVEAMRFDHKCPECYYFEQSSEISIACDSCERGEMWTHRVRTASTTPIELVLACPEHGQEWSVERRTDGDGIALVGNPAITGDAEGCDPYGYQTAPGQGTDAQEASE